MSSYYELTSAQRARVQRLQNGKIIKTKFGFCRHLIGSVFVYTSYTDHSLDLEFRDSEESAENAFRAMIADESKQSIKLAKIHAIYAEHCAALYDTKLKPIIDAL
jgi:hypothetical protein